MADSFSPGSHNLHSKFHQWRGIYVGLNKVTLVITTLYIIKDPKSTELETRPCAYFKILGHKKKVTTTSLDKRNKIRMHENNANMVKILNETTLNIYIYII